LSGAYPLQYVAKNKNSEQTHSEEKDLKVSLFQHQHLSTQQEDTCTFAIICSFSVFGWKWSDLGQELLAECV